MDNLIAMITFYNLRKHWLQKYSQRFPVKFGALMVLMMFLIKVPFAPLIIALGGAGTTETTLKFGLVGVLISFLFLPIETLLGQTFPIWLLRKFKVHRWRWLILGSALFFGLLHLVAGLGTFFVGFSGGIALCLCWLLWREQSFLRAFLSTTAVHVVHNVIAMGLFFIIKG